MPEYIDSLDEEVIANMKNQSFHEIACTVAQMFFGEDIEPEVLDGIVKDTLSFETPVVPVKGNIYSLELFHGPTLAFKDVGGRFMARLLGYFIKKEGLKQVNVLVATSGDTGSAVANGFLGVPGIHVYVLYPKGKVSPIQECQFTTLGQNITALEIDGTFDDCLYGRGIKPSYETDLGELHQRSPFLAPIVLLFQRLRSAGQAGKSGRAGCLRAER